MNYQKSNYSEGGFAEKTQRYLLESIDRFPLVLSFIRRDIGIKYSQSLLGISWVVLQPITAAVIFTFFFTYLFSFFQDLLIPYHLFAYSGYLCWLLFSQTIASAGLSLVHEERIVKKVYFPRVLIPLAKTGACFVDFLIGLLVLLVISTFWKPTVALNVFLTLPAVALLLINGLSIAIGLSVLTLRYRDLHHIIPYLINFGIWLTPVFFPYQAFPDDIRFIVEANPLAFSIELFRSLLFGLEIPEINFVVASSQLLMFLILVFGILYFVKIDQDLSDYL
ncbi:MAG: ABC transporter permease [Flavobacteriales bacterium]|nr:ABC transporter permease [Flavobacteriales bacterium]